MMLPCLRVSRALSIAALAAAVCCAPGCKAPLSAEEKAARAELRQALRDRAFPRAEELALRIVGAHPRENGSWARLVSAQLGARDLLGAAQSIEEWRQVLSSPSAKREELAGNLARQQQDTALALECWAKALALQPRNTRVLRKVARLQHARGDWAREDDARTKLLEIEENATERMERALCRRRLHRWPEALEDAQRAQVLAPDDVDVRRGAKLFERLTKFLDGIRELDARLAVKPDDDQLLSDRALQFLRSEDAELALEDSEHAAKLAPWAMRPRLFRALALLQTGRNAEAGIERGLRLERLGPENLETITRLDAEISAELENADLYASRAWQLNDIGQPRLALEDAETALRFDAKSAAAAAERSYALTKIGRGEEAFAQVLQATEWDANSATAWQYRGELEMLRGDHDAAIASLTRALAIRQTPAALEKREACYRSIGVLAKAEEDRRAREALSSR